MEQNSHVKHLFLITTLLYLFVINKQIKMKNLLFISTLILLTISTSCEKRKDKQYEINVVVDQIYLDPYWGDGTLEKVIIETKDGVEEVTTGGSGFGSQGNNFTRTVTSNEKHSVKVSAYANSHVSIFIIPKGEFQKVAGGEGYASLKY